MNVIEAMARPDILTLKSYRPASFATGSVRLNANEAPWQSAADTSARGLNCYPPHRADELGELLAKHYGVASSRVLVTRGSSEAIDLLIRCFCRPGTDDIVICPPAFGMYQVYADIQGAGVRAVPLRGERFELDARSIVEQWDATTRLVFLTSPNNPTGNRFPTAAVDEIVNGLRGRGIVIIDAAYAEFSRGDDLTLRYQDEAHVCVLRTLSKAYGMAGARCGSLIADPRLLDIVGRVMPPYGVPTPTIEIASAAVAKDSIDVMPGNIQTLLRDRDEFARALGQLPLTERVWPSDANFLLARFHDAASVLRRAASVGILLRDLGEHAGLENCLRITVGDRDINNRLLAALSEQRENWQ